MMARAAVVRSPTIDGLHSMHHRSPISKSRGLNENALWEKSGRNLSGIIRNRALSGKPKNFARISGNPITNTLRELRDSSHTAWESYTPGKPTSYTHNSGKPTSYTHNSGKPTSYTHNSGKPTSYTHNSGKSTSYTHNSGKPRSYALASLEPTNSPHTPWQPRNSPHPPWESHTSGKPRSYTVTPWEPRNFTSTPGKPENSTRISGKPRSVPDLYPFKTPTKERDQQKEDSASLQEIRHPSKRRNSLGYAEMHQQESIHQEKNAEQALKAKVRLDAMFEKENHNSKCLNESIGTPTSGIAKGLGKKGKLSLNKSSTYLKCYTCEKFVKDMHFEEHLFFGETECTQCNWKISSCEAFRENKIDQLMGNSTCLHTLIYCMTPSEYISNKISQESIAELDRRKLTLYVRSLSRLEGSDPWKEAIDQCLNSFEGETSQPSEANEEHLNVSESETAFRVPEEAVPTSKHEIKNAPSLANENGDLILSQSYNLEHLNDAVEYEIAKNCQEVWMERSPALFTESSTDSLPHRQTNGDTCSGNLVKDVVSQGTSLADKAEIAGGLNGAEKTIIETPSNGHYLIVRHAIEECPMCYTEFCPSRFTVNINTFLLSTVCIGCDLTVYIIFDPPDGSAPKIFIETESAPPEKPKKRKPRVKDFFKR